MTVRDSLLLLLLVLLLTTEADKHDICFFCTHFPDGFLGSVSCISTLSDGP